MHKGLKKIKIEGFGEAMSHSKKVAAIFKDNFLKYCSSMKLTEIASEADIILIVGDGGIFQKQIRRSKLYKAHGDRCILFSESDNITPILPGIYASLDSKCYDKKLHVGGFYVNNPDLNLITKQKGIKPIYLYSFMGNATTHKVRSKIVERLKHERGVIKDVGNLAQNTWSKWDLEEMAKISSPYCKLIQKSKFVLCPRGCGTSSIRLFETMKLGRVPVIISDNWVPPSGPNWNACSVRLKEDEIERIPSTLEQLEDKSDEMGQQAEREWKFWFSNRGNVNSILHFLENQKAINWEKGKTTYFKSLLVGKMWLKHTKRKVLNSLRRKIIKKDMSQP